MNTSTTESSLLRGGSVRASVNYALDTGSRPRFHANDHSLDTVALDPQTVTVTDARQLVDAPRLNREGLQLFHLPTQVSDFRDEAEVAARYPNEIAVFIRDLTGADAVVVSGPATLRFGERSREAGSRDNSNAARLVHSDVSPTDAIKFADSENPHAGRRFKRVAQHNIWRSFSGAPQDVPLGLCDARSVAETDLILADAAFDRGGEIVWFLEALLMRCNPAHRWLYYSDMTPSEIVVFKRHDTDSEEPCFVPHSAFTDPNVARGVPPRASIELRTIAYWFE